MSRLNTRDPDGAKAFYGAIFGWDFDTFDAGGMEITLWRLRGTLAASRSSRFPATWSA